MGSMGQCALGIELREQRSQFFIAGSCLRKAMSYFFSEAITRSRGNMVEPLTPSPGLMPFTRTFGASETASSRTRWLTRGFADVVGFAAALGHDGIRGTGQHDGSVEILFAQDAAPLHRPADSWR